MLSFVLFCLQIALCMRLLFRFLLLFLIVVTLLQLYFLCTSCLLCFFVIHNADASSPHIDPHASGRSPHTWRMCSVAYVGTHVLTERGSPEVRNIIHHPSAAEQLASSLPLAQ